MASFESSQKQVSTLTEAEMRPLWQLILTAYREANKKIDQDIALVYAKYLDTADPADYYNIMIQYNRLEKLKAQVSTEYSKAAKKAGVQVANSSSLAISNNYYRSEYTLSWFSPNAGVTMDFALLDQRIIDSSVFGTAETWKAIQAESLRKYGSASLYQSQAGTLSDLLRRDASEDLVKLQQALTQGFIQGKSYAQVSNDVHDIIGRELVDPKTGKRKYTGSKAKASRIVRTEGTRNLNAGSLASMHEAEAQGVPIQKQWSASFDIRTRGTHGTADGQTVGLDENFSVGSATGQAPAQLSTVEENVNCRCSTISVIDGVEPESRIAVNPSTGEREVFSFRYFDQWAKDNDLKRDKSGKLYVKG